MTADIYHHQTVRDYRRRRWHMTYTYALLTGISIGFIELGRLFVLGGYIACGIVRFIVLIALIPVLALVATARKTRLMSIGLMAIITPITPFLV